MKYTSSQTETFSVGAWSVCSSCPIVDAPATCSTSMGLLQWSCGHGSCCGSVGRCTSWRRQNAADGDRCRQRVGCRRQCMVEPGQPATDRHATLYSTRWRTGSQCSCRRTGVMWSRRLAPVTRRAAAFWMDWTFCNRPSDTPYNMELQ